MTDVLKRSGRYGVIGDGCIGRAGRVVPVLATPS